MKTPNTEQLQWLISPADGFLVIYFSDLFHWSKNNSNDPTFLSGFFLFYAYALGL